MSDKVIHLNSSNFDATIASDKPVLVDFWAPWCGPCRMLGPTIDELAETVGGSALICKLNVDESPDIAQKYGVNQIPTGFFCARLSRGEMDGAGNFRIGFKFPGGRRIGARGYFGHAVLAFCAVWARSFRRAEKFSRQILIFAQ